MKTGYPKNSCMGGYGKCLDVKITNACDGSCDFCIEKGGYCPGKSAPVSTLIKAAIDQDDCKTVLVLGGEPLLYPYLEKFLAGIRPYKEHIYITTNGSHLNAGMAKMLAKYLDGINISIHHYTERRNNAVYRTAAVDFDKLKEAIAVFNEAGVPVRFNSNLVNGTLDSKAAAAKMIKFAADMGADEIRFAELQDVGDDIYVDAASIFPGLNDDPYHKGCEQIISRDPIVVKVKVACGCVNSRKPYPADARPCGECFCKVLYPNGEVTSGWVEPEPKRKVQANPEKTEPRPYDPLTCHGRSYDVTRTVRCHN